MTLPVHLHGDTAQRTPRAGVSTEPPVRPRCPRPAVLGGSDAGTAEGGAACPQVAAACFQAFSSSLWGTCLLDTLPQRQAELPAWRSSPVTHPTPPHLPEPPPPATPVSFLRRRGRSQWPRSMVGMFLHCSWRKVGFVLMGIQPRGGSRKQKALRPILSESRGSWWVPGSGPAT